MIEIDSSHLIIKESDIYGLTTKEQYCPEALSYHPCDFCELHDSCLGNDPQLCTTFGATTEEFYARCGVVDYDEHTGQRMLIAFTPFKFI